MRMHDAEHSIHPRPLVEEVPSTSIANLQKEFGRRKLLAAVRDAKPVHFQVNGAWYSAYLYAAAHRLPGRIARWSDPDRGDARLWFVCIGCRRLRRKLYCLPYSEKIDSLSDIRCRLCHGLRYKSQNSGNRLWWKNIAAPLKQLLRHRERLIARKQTARVVARLAELDQAIWILRQRALSKSRSRKQAVRSEPVHRTKRPYRDISILM